MTETLLENQKLHRKSLRVVTGPTTDFDDLACTCVCFANSAGGQVLIGIEEDASCPTADQRIGPALTDRMRKRHRELTVNVFPRPEIRS